MLGLPYWRLIGDVDVNAGRRTVRWNAGDEDMCRLNRHEKNRLSFGNN